MLPAAGVNSVGQPVILNRGRQVVHAMNAAGLCGRIRHNSSNVGGVTAGKMGRNSGCYNDCSLPATEITTAPYQFLIVPLLASLSLCQLFLV